MATFPQTCRKNVAFLSGCLFICLSLSTFPEILVYHFGLSLKGRQQTPQCCNSVAGHDLIRSHLINHKTTPSRQPSNKDTAEKQQVGQKQTCSSFQWLLLLKSKAWLRELQTKLHDENTCWLSNLQDLKTNWITRIHLRGPFEKLPRSSSTNDETISTSRVGNSLLRQLAASVSTGSRGNIKWGNLKCGKIHNINRNHNWTSVLPFCVNCFPIGQQNPINQVAAELPVVVLIMLS